MEHQTHIRQIIETLLNRLGVPFQEITVIEQGDRLAFVIKSSDSSILIGTRGAHISAINHLVKRIVGKKLNAVSTDANPVDFYVDVNDYHDRLLGEIRTKAQILAERARSFKTTVEMDPMSSYERMIIHTFFEGVPDIETHSEGT